MSTAANRTFGQWKILLVAPDQETNRQINELIRNHLPFSTVTELKDYPSRTDLAAILPEQTPNLCFVDVDKSREWSIPMLGDLATLDPKLPVVAIHAGNDSDFILRTLRSGATEFLILPLTPEQFYQVMDRLTTLHKGARNGNNARVYMVAPAKGACGASTIACSMAFLWRKFGSQRTLLADMDPYAGTISFQLKLKQSFSFVDALTREGLDEELWKGMVFPLNSVDVLLAPEQPVHGIDESHDPGPLVEFARMNYDTVLLDTGGVYGRWATGMAHHCDELLLVTTNELTSLQATQRSLMYLDRARVDRSKVRIIVNRFNRDFGLNRDVIEAALHSSVLEVIPSDYDCVQKALVDGKPVAPASPVGKSLLQLASALSGKEATEPQDAKQSGLSSLLGSLFGRK